MFSNAKLPESHASQNTFAGFDPRESVHSNRYAVSYPGCEARTRRPLPSGKAACIAAFSYLVFRHSDFGQLDPKRIRNVLGISASRAPSLGPAAMVLAALARRLEPSELVVSAYGLREGLLHRGLLPDVRGLDPLIEAAREEGVRQGRFAEHGDLLDRWIAPLFGDETRGFARLRHTDRESSMTASSRPAPSQPWIEL